MNRTGMGRIEFQRSSKCAKRVVAAFRGLHWYDGHISSGEPEERKALAHKGYDSLMEIVKGGGGRWL